MILQIKEFAYRENPNTSEDCVGLEESNTQSLVAQEEIEAVKRACQRMFWKDPIVIVRHEL